MEHDRFTLTGFAGHFQWDSYAWHRPALSDAYNRDLVPLKDAWGRYDLHKPSPYLNLYPVYALADNHQIPEGVGVIVVHQEFEASLKRLDSRRSFLAFSPTHSYSLASYSAYQEDLLTISSQEPSHLPPQGKLFKKLVEEELSLSQRVFSDWQ